MSKFLLFQIVLTISHSLSIGMAYINEIHEKMEKLVEKMETKTAESKSKYMFIYLVISKKSVNCLLVNKRSWYCTDFYQTDTLSEEVCIYLTISPKFVCTCISIKCARCPYLSINCLNLFKIYPNYSTNWQLLYKPPKLSLK